MLANWTKPYLNNHSAEPCIAIFTDDPGWHGRQLREAFAERGYQSQFLSLMDTHLDLSGTQPQIIMPGFEQGLPTGVFVRGVPGGSLEQVILRLDLLHMLKHLGVVVYNHGRAIERTVDKAMTSFLLKVNGLPSPDTWVCESLHEARKRVLNETARGRKLVLKPLFGSQGEGLALISHAADLSPAEDSGDVFYLQSFIEKSDAHYEDIRVFVIGDKPVAAMRRQSAHWITNRAQGGSCHPLDLQTEASELAIAAVKAVDIDYAGVDLIRDREGKLWITEVNSIPAWWGLQKHTDFNIAAAIAEDFVARIQDTDNLQVVY